MHTRVKICGVTRREDLEYAAELGVDAVGLVFQRRSPRRLAPEAACALLERRPAFLSAVALFMDASDDEVRRVLDAAAFDFIQFHGSESPDFCASFGVPYLKAVPMGGENGDVASYVSGYLDIASGFVLDSHHAGEIGGTGEVFDWGRVSRVRGLPPSAQIILAGGLTPGNVAAGIRRVRPAAVDVASGVESDKGVKDHHLMREFVAAVRAADLDAGRDDERGNENVA